MEIKKFRNHYGLELINVSHENIQPGDLVWDRLTSTPVFSHRSMPNTIYNAFLDANLINEDEFKTIKSECRNIPLIDAAIADKKVDVNTELIAEMQHPLIGNIGGSFKLETIRKFCFGDIKVKIMPDLLRVKIDQFLEQMKKNRWEEYDGRIRRVNMITELYYGSVRLVVERGLAEDFESALNKTGVEILARAEGSTSVEYEFEHDTAPFAMRIERIKTFNG